MGSKSKHYTPEQRAAWSANRKRSQSDIIDMLPDDVRELAYMVGRWVWVSFDTMPARSVLNELKALGFRWSSKRKAWQHPCGDTRRTHARNYDPRDKYGRVAVDDDKTGRAA